ncbi:MAG: hypothetical protein ACK5JN_02840 [Kluyvera sp.]|uniref:hypothetical protein n=1 Tax=Kluyvera sp. TaxID=1538228 RepID=UPI003A8421D4
MTLYPATDRQRRLNAANALIQVIASCGKQFFRNKSTGQVAELTFDWGGRVWLTDEVTGQRLPAYDTTAHNWRHFSHGQQLRFFIRYLCEYILDGRKLEQSIFVHNDGQERWGYGDDIWQVIAAAATADILAKSKG